MCNKTGASHAEKGAIGPLFFVFCLKLLRPALKCHPRQEVMPIRWLNDLLGGGHAPLNIREISGTTPHFLNFELVEVTHALTPSIWVRHMVWLSNRRLRRVPCQASVRVRFSKQFGRRNHFSERLKTSHVAAPIAWRRIRPLSALRLWTKTPCFRLLKIQAPANQSILHSAEVSSQAALMHACPSRVS